VSATKTTQEQGNKTLAKLIKILSRKKFLTVQEIAEKSGFSTVSIYKRLDTLEERGCLLQFASVERAEGQRGPTPTGFRLVENRVSKRILTSG
jgi:predicted ArsR family transcriptional regulator